ncbi:germ cell nuclear acidic protein [Saccopteryx leptura]|uniref:germ cell nuclear acidic protein n=1 Tax=Saccopteryx leptura TaxID=249018 RepID=UPI00339CCDC5
MEQFSTLQCKSSGHSDENICQPPNDPDKELVPVVGHPRKKKCATEDPEFKELNSSKKPRPSKKKPRVVRSKQCDTGNSVCNIPGCFLQNIEKLKEYSGRNFKKNKDELVQKLYTLINESVFDKKTESVIP